MRKATVELSAILMILATFGGYVLAIVEPEKAGLVGGILYLITQHELGKATLRLQSIMTVLFMGFAGSWIVTHVIVIDFYTSASLGTTQFMSAVFGFLAYDTLLMFGKNTDSVIGYFKDVVKSKINRSTGND